MKICERSRKRRRVSGSYSAMNQDVLVEILSRLPVKSLIRFRCVSQEWNALTRNAHFVARHLSFSDPNRYLFLDRHITGNDGNETKLYGLSLFQDDGVKAKFRSLHLPFFKHKSWVAANYVGSSNGLVCLLLEDKNCITKIREDFIVVCNPATRDFRYLPTPTPFRMKGDRPLLGFEFMHDIREYKLANIFPYASDNGSEVGLTLEAQVFTQSTNSWRQVTNTLEFPSSKRECHSFSSITVNGVMCWMARDANKSNEYCALSFDIYDEVFHVLPLPKRRQPVYDHPEDGPPLLVWKNSFATILPSPGGYYQELWVMAKSGTPWTFFWTRKFCICASSIPSGRLMGVLTDQLLLRTWKEINVLYDPETEVIRYIPTYRSAKKYYQFRNYVQSLLPVR